jgi:hypothetical protein
MSDSFIVSESPVVENPEIPCTAVNHNLNGLHDGFVISSKRFAAVPRNPGFSPNIPDAVLPKIGGLWGCLYRVEPMPADAFIAPC